MALDITRKNSYAQLCMIIDEFEKAAMSSGKREGYLVVANGPLSGMESILGGAKRALGGVKKSRDTAGRTETSDVNATAPTDDEQVLNGSITTQPPVFDPKGGNVSLGGTQVIADADLLDLMGGPDNPVKSYLEDCLGCNLRLKFDWQIKPLNLMLPINGMLDTINDALSLFEGLLDPFKSLENICNLLNQMRSFCIPDLIALLLALKMLLKKHLAAAFQIKLDWTVLLGPILKVIIDAIASLLENILAILLAPIDCVLAVLNTANDLEKASRGLLGELSAPIRSMKNNAGDAQGAQAQGGTGIFDGSGFTARDVKWDKDATEGNAAPDPGKLQVSNRLFDGPQAGGGGKGFGGSKGTGTGAEASAGFTLPTGFILKSDTKVLDALKDPAWVNTTYLEKLIVPVQEARQFIVDTVGNILKALYSLEALVSGGLGLNLDILSVLTFISDMISLVLMIIKMLQKNKNVTDWCNFLEENPQLLEQHLRARFGPVRVEVQEVNDQKELALRLGPQTVGIIQTCTNARTSFDQQLLQQWINDLKA